MRERDVLTEIRAVRDEIARRHGGDAGSLSRALAERSRLAGRVVVRFAPRPPQPPRATGAQSVASESAPLSSVSVA